uniref:Uncharacterized protein n=1 Tax=Megaselia scalaris TaxID=36166 RepID=T1H1E3_MEGSC
MSYLRYIFIAEREHTDYFQLENHVNCNVYVKRDCVFDKDERCSLGGDNLLQVLRQRHCRKTRNRLWGLYTCVRTAVVEMKGRRGHKPI